MALWVGFTGCILLLLQLFWLTTSLWGWISLLFCFLLMSLIFKRVYFGASKVGIDELGAFCLCRGKRFSLEFLRFNDVQLVARIHKEGSWLSRFWPAYFLIYRDSVSDHDYRVLRSYAAQQKILLRSEEARKHYSK